MIRRGSTELKLENEGLIVFLYDEAHREELVSTELDLFGGFAGASELDDKALQDVASRGLMVAYEKIQDDDVEAELTVGRAMSGREAKKACWREPQRGYLRLPTGELCVETYSSLRLGGEEPEQRGARVQVKPGDYVVTVHRMDPSATIQAGLDPQSPDEFIVLTGVRKDVPDPAPAMLVMPEEEATSDATPACQVEGDSFWGQIRFWPEGDSFLLNMDRAAAEQIGLQAGMGLHFSTTEPELTLEAVYLGDKPGALSKIRDTWAEHQETAPELAEAMWSSGTDFVGELLLCHRVKATATVAKQHRDKWLPVSGQILRNPADRARQD